MFAVPTLWDALGRIRCLAQPCLPPTPYKPLALAYTHLPLHEVPALCSPCLHVQDSQQGPATPVGISHLHEGHVRLSSPRLPI